MRMHRCVLMAYTWNFDVEEGVIHKGASMHPYCLHLVRFRTGCVGGQAVNPDASIILKSFVRLREQSTRFSYSAFPRSHKRAVQENLLNLQFSRSHKKEVKENLLILLFPDRIREQWTKISSTALFQIA